MYDHVELSEADADTLAAEGPWGDGEFVSIDPARIEYGAAWTDIIYSACSMNDLLEAAAVAGRLGFCDSGIALALRAAHLTAISEADNGDPLWLHAGVFRRFSMICEEIVADLEDRTASLHFEAAQRRRRFSKIRRREAEAAESRAESARKRLRAAARDNRAHDEVTWWADAETAAVRRP